MTQNQQLIEVSKNLQDLMQKKARALPKNFNQTRFLQNSLMVLADTKGIEKCLPVSIARTMLQGAFLGLDFFMGECYAIPYGNQLNFQTDYKGEIKICKQYSPAKIKDIFAKVVKEGDEFEAGVYEGKQFVNFKPKNFNEGAVIGAFAVCYYEDGSIIYDEMSLKKIEETRKYFSKAPNSPAWMKTPEEMYKKTVIRRLCKVIDLQFDNDDQKKAFDEGADIDRSKIKETIDVDVQNPFDKEEKPLTRWEKEDAQKEAV